MPHSIQAEQALLGALIMRPHVIDELPVDMTPDVFYRKVHQDVFAALRKLRDKKIPADLLTLKEALREDGVLDDIGGVAYLASLTDGVPVSANAPHYAHLIVEYATRRDIIALANDICGRAYAGTEPLDELADYAQRRVLDVTTRASGDGPVSIGSLMSRISEALDRAEAGHPIVTGLPSGFEHLDAIIGGFQRADMILVAARPSMGKTSFVLNVATAVALTGKVVAFFSVEMSKEQLLWRTIGSLADLDIQRLRHGGKIREKDFARIVAAMNDLANAPLVIDDTSALAIGDLRTRARRVKVEHGGLDLIVIDYIQLLTARGDFESRQQELSFISRQTKAMAKELNVPVIALSQLSRAPEAGKGRRPQLSDLRESGALEQDADVVMFLWRQEDDDDQPVELIIGKQRNGPTGTVKLAFLKERTTFKPFHYDAENGD